MFIALLLLRHHLGRHTAPSPGVSPRLNALVRAVGASLSVSNFVVVPGAEAPGAARIHADRRSDES
jgi:hypothetical protein